MLVYFPLPFKIFSCLVFVLGYVKPDPNPIHDYCVAETKNPRFFTNGLSCINPDHTLPTHFASSSLSRPGDMSQFMFNVTMTNVDNLPGLNMFGLVMARIDIAVNGLVPPHSHPRASEVMILIEGSVLVGFMDTTNRLYRQQLRPGDCFVFPKGLIHFIYNTDATNPAWAISGLSSQNPGTQVSSLSMFTSKPPMPDEVLKMGFKITGQDVVKIRKNLGG